MFGARSPPLVAGPLLIMSDLEFVGGRAGLSDRRRRCAGGGGWKREDFPLEGGMEVAVELDRLSDGESWRAGGESPFFRRATDGQGDKDGRLRV